MPRKEYCFDCDKEVNVTVKEENIDMNIKGVNFSYLGNIAYCDECGKEVYIAELDEENIKTGNEKYREKLGVIKVCEIEDILLMYNVGKEPLSKLLGWGEKTISRYCNGLMPSKEYSDRLKELKNPCKMKELFDRGKESLTEVASRKLGESIQCAFDNSVKKQNIFDIKNLTKYLLNKYGYSITINKLDDSIGGGWLISVPELPGCVCQGRTVEEALSNIDAIVEVWVKSEKKRGHQIPPPQIKKVENEYDGKLVLSIPQKLHRELAIKAESENINLNELITFLLTKGLYEKDEETPISQSMKILSNISDEWWNSNSNQSLRFYSNSPLSVNKGGRF